MDGGRCIAAVGATLLNLVLTVCSPSGAHCVLVSSLGPSTPHLKVTSYFSPASHRDTLRTGVMAKPFVDPLPAGNTLVPVAFPPLDWLTLLSTPFQAVKMLGTLSRHAASRCADFCESC